MTPTRYLDLLRLLSLLMIIILIQSSTATKSKLHKSQEVKKIHRTRRQFSSTELSTISTFTPSTVTIGQPDVDFERLLGRELSVSVPGANNNNELGNSPLPETTTEIVLSSIAPVECNNDTMKQDFGVACLRAGIQNVTGTSAAPVSPRYFQVQQMMPERKKVSNQMRTPAQSARQILVNRRGYVRPEVVGYRTTNQNGYPEITTIYFRNNPEPEITSGVPLSRPAPPPLPPLPPPPPQPRPQVPAKNPFLRQQPLLPPELQEDLELLKSLKMSLGVLQAQTRNVKQRAASLYREAKRRRLGFFDMLLQRTHNFITDRQIETQQAMVAIDEAIDALERHRELIAWHNLRRSSRYSGPNTRFPNGLRKPPKAPVINPKAMDLLLYNGLNHAKRLMGTIRELHGALDEFEETFNFPRFEPNQIDDQAVPDEYYRDLELRRKRRRRRRRREIL